ncbi:hypothetical protein Mycch_2220 [Mycolicibacterium chubuense NBB4]|uniref:Secreted protein n=1 Tax=Mycolicibacterium chubuense (strain NBB4) TaxID=710421 RepID=I4BI93_MYCCN|nr:DUF6636 domain-containing protein [Mycolicibacterium chubuense]AFM17000.1 hypothetical protein Mycch_2220 [Mycolicibacterium chubuense NBB4]
MTHRGSRLSAPVAVLCVAAVLHPAAAVADIVGFTSPSRNVGCMLDDDYVRCDIAERQWSPPPRPAGCPAVTGYGQGIELQATGPASFVCAGDTAMGGGPALPYGQVQARAGISCGSEPSGMRCSNSEGHGFTLSRQGYTLL